MGQAENETCCGHMGPGDETHLTPRLAEGLSGQGMA